MNNAPGCARTSALAWSFPTESARLKAITYWVIPVRFDNEDALKRLVFRGNFQAAVCKRLNQNHCPKTQIQPLMHFSVDGKLEKSQNWEPQLDLRPFDELISPEFTSESLSWVRIPGREFLSKWSSFWFHSSSAIPSNPAMQTAVLTIMAMRSSLIDFEHKTTEQTALITEKQP